MAKSNLAGRQILDDPKKQRNPPRETPAEPLTWQSLDLYIRRGAEGLVAAAMIPAGRPPESVWENPQKWTNLSILVGR